VSNLWRTETRNQRSSSSRGTRIQHCAVRRHRSFEVELVSYPHRLCGTVFRDWRFPGRLLSLRFRATGKFLLKQADGSLKLTFPQMARGWKTKPGGQQQAGGRYCLLALGILFPKASDCVGSPGFLSTLVAQRRWYRSPGSAGAAGNFLLRKPDRCLQGPTCWLELAVSAGNRSSRIAPYPCASFCSEIRNPSGRTCPLRPRGR
jgi:hypothetical protein